MFSFAQLRGGMLTSKINEDLHPLESGQEDQRCWAVKAFAY